MTARILVVDDIISNVKLLEAKLAAEYFDVVTAYNGEEALKRIDEEMPDIVLLDVMMPKLSGFEVCQQLKGNPRTRSIMILMVTALNELGDIERAVAAGTDDFLCKPVNKLALLKRVEHMLQFKDIKDENERLRRYIQEMEDSDDHH